VLEEAVVEISDVLEEDWLELEEVEVTWEVDKSWAVLELDWLVDVVVADWVAELCLVLLELCIKLELCVELELWAELEVGWEELSEELELGVGWE
jgi:hypothetical protein